ncbi:MAG TPA: GNAT family N-acetyltransferase [Candidatus Acidoferrales bacterium]|nr:GNAT family N-acetyltransferase [Candidatus Acidoferrales bacterium]
MQSTEINNQTAPQRPVQRNDNEKVEIRIARVGGEVEALREVWTRWGGHRDSDIDFVLTIIEAYPEALRPHVISIYRNGQPDAILIGRLERKRLTFKIGYLNVFRPWARCLTFVYGALRGNASLENTQILVREVMNCLNQDEADVALLEFVPINSPVYKLALKLPGILSRDTLPSVQGHELMLVPDSIEEVYRHMSGDRRIELRRRIRKIESHPAGQPKIVCYREVSGLDRLFRDAEEIAKKTYQRGLGAGFADAPDVRMRLGLAARKGWLRANVLYIGDRPVAFWIGMLYGTIFVSEYMGYDPEFRQSSPGMVLIMRTIEGFCSHANGDNVNELDFGLGHAEYKAALCSKNWLEASIFIFSPTVKGLLLKSMRVATRAADGTARKVLSSTKFLPRLKRLWRNLLAKQAGIQRDPKSQMARLRRQIASQATFWKSRNAPSTTADRGK